MLSFEFKILGWKERFYAQWIESKMKFLFYGSRVNPWNYQKFSYNPIQHTPRRNCVTTIAIIQSSRIVVDFMLNLIHTTLAQAEYVDTELVRHLIAHLYVCKRKEKKVSKRIELKNTYKNAHYSDV